MNNRSDDQNAMRQYYVERAPVYDSVYGYPERQADLRKLEALVEQTFIGREVLEVAAGTGYWTPFIARSAQSVCATDGAVETLEQLQRKMASESVSQNSSCQVAVRVADAYALHSLGRRFSAAFAGCWFSHVPLERQAEWLAQLHAQLEPGASVLLLDNASAQCERLPITRQDALGNTYQERSIDGAGHKGTFEVLKNFPSATELLELLGERASGARFVELDHYWYCQYTR